MKVYTYLLASPLSFYPLSSQSRAQRKVEAKCRDDGCPFSFLFWLAKMAALCYYAMLCLTENENENSFEFREICVWICTFYVWREWMVKWKVHSVRWRDEWRRFGEGEEEAKKMWKAKRDYMLRIENEWEEEGGNEK